MPSNGPQTYAEQVRKDSGPGPVFNRSALSATLVAFCFSLGALWFGEPEIAKPTVAMAAGMLAAAFFCLDRGLTLIKFHALEARRNRKDGNEA